MIDQGNRMVYENGAQIGYGMDPIFSGSGVPAVDLKADNGITWRKRSRDSSSISVPNAYLRPTLTFLDAQGEKGDGRDAKEKPEEISSSGGGRNDEEEIVKLGKLNWALEEKAKSLTVENEIWRELAETNEATANVLPTNLAQHRRGAAESSIDDAESCCGSHRERAAEEYRCCRNCGKEESSVQCMCSFRRPLSSM